MCEEAAVAVEVTVSGYGGTEAGNLLEELRLCADEVNACQVVQLLLIQTTAA